MNKFKKYFFGSALFFFFTQSFAQITFQKTFSTSGGCGLSVQQTSDEGYIIGGWLLGDLPEFNMCLMKTDKYGDTLWLKKFKSESEAIGYSVQQTNDGGFIIGGKTVNSSTNGFYLVKTDNNGDTIWSRIYSSYVEDICSLHQTHDGGYIIAGTNRTSISSDYKVYVIKTNGYGDTLWTKNYSDNSQFSSWGYSIVQTVDLGYIITGTHSDSTNSSEVFLIKADSAGNLLWAKTYGSINNDQGYYIQQTHDGGFIIAGASSGFGFTSGYLIRTNSNGNVLWTRLYSVVNTSGSYLTFKYVSENNDGGFIITGYDSYSSSLRNMVLLNTDFNGNLLWAKYFGGSEYDEGLCVQQTFDGGFIVAGYESSFEDGLYLVKTDHNGNSGCNQNEITITVSTPPTQETYLTTHIFSFTNTTVLFPHTAVSRGCGINTHCNFNGISEKSFNIFPNPTNNHFTVYLLNNTIEKIEVFNMFGEIVYLNENVNQGSKEIFLTLSTGAYFVKVTSDEKETTAKLIVMNQ